MQIDIATTDGITVLAVSGRMDATTVNDFSETCQKLLAEGAQKFVIDLGGLEYISSAGLRGILMLEKSSKKNGSSLAFCSMQAMVADMFKLSGFTSILHVYPTREEALDSLR
ncbi:MAG: STAS domain-containing protein [Desulfovibrionaceae bacterium]|nr:STAS domain-containing protein [Desulfovibrionaceae bacterium]MBR5735045.1 STAS domain-containing protein [Desulfovibrionaceae bacterium]